MPMAQDVLAAAGVGFERIDAVAVTIGPGSFTGIRVGLAAAHGIALARRVPVIGVVTLEAVARAARKRLAMDRPAPRAILVALETKRADFYVQSFTVEGVALDEPIAALARIVAGRLPAGRILLVGDAADRLRAALGAINAEIVVDPILDASNAVEVAEIGAERLARSTTESMLGRFPVPLYLRAPDVTLPAIARGRAT